MSDNEWTAEKIAKTRQAFGYYADDLPRAWHSPEVVLSLLDALDSARESERSKNAELQLASEQVTLCAAELERARAERDARGALIEHMWAHEWFEINGYWLMDAEQKALYSQITGYFPDAP